MTASPRTIASDVLVVGGGPAGLSAAVALARSRRSVVVVDAGQPRNAASPAAHNYLGREGVAPSALLADGRADLATYGGTVLDGTVEAVETLDALAPDPRFRARLADGSTVTARRLLITTGLVDELPDVAGLAPRWGLDVLHCPYCHGWEVRDAAVGVLVTSPMATHQALLFRQLTDDVTVFLHRGPEPSAEDRERLEARGVRLVPGEVAEVVTEADALAGVRLASGEVIRCQALVVAPRMTVRSELLARLGVPTTELRVGDHVVGTYAVAEPTGATVVPGVYVAGNVANLQAQVISAAAAGLSTGAFLNADLVEEDAEHAVRALSAREMVAAR